MELFDTHCHLDVTAFDPDRDEVLAAARANGVRHLLIPAIMRSGWEDLWVLCTGDPDLYPAIGLHPTLLTQHDPQRDLAALKDCVHERRPAAIGEIGLDFQLRELDRARQQALFAAQLAIAEHENLPVVLHVRKAHDAILATLQRYTLPGGFCHAFNGSLQQAGRYRELGFRLGFGGMLTRPNAYHLRKLATRLPLSDLVLETDAPGMSGATHRYQRNSPQWLPEILDVLTELRPETRETIARETTANALAVLTAGRIGV